MRSFLEPYIGNKIEVIAEVVRKGYRNSYYAGDNLNTVGTMLLRNVYDSYGNFICDHVWIKLSNKLKKYKCGDVIKLKFTVVKYTKRDNSTDYGLIYQNHKNELKKSQSIRKGGI